MGVCYIVGAGDFFGEIHPKTGDLVIAADGGCDALARLGVKADVIVGDMDSCDAPTPDVRTVKYPTKKDETDMHLSYLYGKRMGYSKFLVYGGTGGRPDHTFANYSLLFLAKNAGDSMTIVDRDYDIFALENEKISIRDRLGATLSLFAFGGEVRGVSIEGCEYVATGATLTPDFALGVSNKICSECATVSLESGRLLVMLSR